MASDLQSSFTTPGMAAPSGAGDGVSTSGGWDLPDGRKETPNMGDIPALPTTYAVEGAPSGQFGQVGIPPVQSPGTIPTGETGASE